MKFIVDAHLPISLKNWLNQNGQDAIHTRDLPRKNHTEDSEIIRVAMDENRIVISKDSDFPKYRILNGIPDRILMVTTGNIVNKILIQLFENNFEIISRAFEDGYKLVELSNASIIIHE
jgi:predicted nuclease of predicted toxin-antitoxin system